MSYDLYLFKKLEGKSVEESSEVVLENEEIGALSQSDFQVQAQQISATLKAEYPDLEVTMSEDSQSLDIDSPGDGIQILVTPNQIGITVPYWYEGGEAANLFKKLEKITSRIQNQTGYSVYDPQSGAEIKPSDLLQQTEMYKVGVKTVTGIVNSSSASKKVSLKEYGLFIFAVILVLVGYFTESQVPIFYWVVIAVWGGWILYKLR